MIERFLVGLLLVILTTIIHASFMVIGIRFAHWEFMQRGWVKREISKAIVVSFFTAWMFMGVLVEALAWALFYLYEPSITVLPDLETALYFSMVTFTSVGYGDVVLTGSWRILAAVQGATGVIIFGWTTALIFYFIQQVYKKK